MVKEWPQDTSHCPQHQANIIQMKSGTLVNTRLADEYRPQLGCTINEWEYHDFDSDNTRCINVNWEVPP